MEVEMTLAARLAAVTQKIAAINAPQQVYNVFVFLLLLYLIEDWCTDFKKNFFFRFAVSIGCGQQNHHPCSDQGVLRCWAAPFWGKLRAGVCRQSPRGISGIFNGNTFFFCTIIFTLVTFLLSFFLSFWGAKLTRRGCPIYYFAASQRHCVALHWSLADQQSQIYCKYVYGFTTILLVFFYSFIIYFFPSCFVGFESVFVVFVVYFFSFLLSLKKDRNQTQFNEKKSNSLTSLL
jgi:hypothetical protein